VAQRKPLKGQSNRRKRRVVIWAGIVAAMIAVALAVLWFYHPDAVSQQHSDASNATAQYIGSQACVSCHGDEAAEWQKSQHHDAMAHASGPSVRGDFNNAKSSYAGVTSTFFKRGGKFFVNTDGRNGKLADLEVKYTFGVYPLQQSLIEFPDGRLQALSIAWGRASQGKRAASAGFISTQMSSSLTTTSCTGLVHHKTGTSCARTATPRDCAKTTIPPPTGSRHVGRKSRWL